MRIDKPIQVGATKKPAAKAHWLIGFGIESSVIITLSIHTAQVCGFVPLGIRRSLLVVGSLLA
jgi:hypothetical protein